MAGRALNKLIEFIGLTGLIGLIELKRIKAETLYENETSPERNSEPQNSRITNRRISKDGFAMLILFYNRKDTSLRHSTFIIRYSIFAFHEFLLSIKLVAFGCQRMG